MQVAGVRLGPSLEAMVLGPGLFLQVLGARQQLQVSTKRGIIMQAGLQGA